MVGARFPLIPVHFEVHVLNAHYSEELVCLVMHMLYVSNKSGMHIHCECVLKRHCNERHWAPHDKMCSFGIRGLLLF